MSTITKVYVSRGDLPTCNSSLGKGVMPGRKLSHYCLTFIYTFFTSSAKGLQRLLDCCHIYGSI